MRRIGLVGPGNLGRTLALSLPAETCALGPVLSHSKVSSRRAVREMRRGYAVTGWAALADVPTILIAVPQSTLAKVLAEAVEQLPALDRKQILITSLADCAGRAALHRLRNAGSAVGGLLPIALYRRPSLVTPGTTFAMWGSASARRAASDLIKAVGGKYAVLDAPDADAQTLLAAGIFSGALTASIELAVRRLVRAGFPRHRAIEALAPLAETCLQEHRKSRHGPPPPRLPAERADLMRAADAAEGSEATLCRTALGLAFADLR